MSDDKRNEFEATRRKFLSLSALTGAATITAAAPNAAVAQEINCAPVSGSVAWKQAGNNNHLLELQAGGSEAQAAGALRLEYYGHTAFKLTSPKGLSLLFDPWRNDPSGAWGLWFPNEFPRITVDVALSTHAHFDHDALDRVDASSILDRLVGHYSFADVAITGIADKHSTDQPGWYKWIEAVKEFGADPYPPNNPGHLDMVTYVVETAGVRTLIWGDNRANPPEDVWAAWGQVDVLTLPIDGSEHILSYAQANAIIERLKPKVIIPTHYLQKGISSTLTTLQSADSWVDTQPRVRRLEEPTLELTRASIDGLDREVFYFGNVAQKA